MTKSDVKHASVATAWTIYLAVICTFILLPTVAFPKDSVTYSLDPATPTLLLGDNAKFRLFKTTGDGDDDHDDRTEDITDRVRVWTSSDTSVVSVDGTGTATALRPGTATVTAKYPGHDTSALVTVVIVSSVDFSVEPGTTPVGAPIAPAVRVSVLDNNRNPVSHVTVTMSLGPNPPNPAVLAGTLSQDSGRRGIASFPDLTLNYLGIGYSLVATVTTPSGVLSVTSNPFTETRVGDPCLGPEQPACSSTCANKSGDGLNDAWKLAGGIDIDGDGKVGSQYDLLLPGADVNRQDVFVQYDWMDYGTPGNACNAAADCTAISSGHFGEVCGGPQVIPTKTGSCTFFCTADTDCVARGAGHLREKCVASACVHTHDPEALAPAALQAVVDSFAAHKINLHLVRGHPLPHSLVVSFRQNNAVTDSCEGGSLASGSAGEGKYAESVYDLKSLSSIDKSKAAYHYAVFGHYSACDSLANCTACPGGPTVGQTGLAEISGSDFAVSLGSRFQDLNHEPGIYDVGSTFMHELGHNLGLRHGGGVDSPCSDPGAACPGGGFCTVTPVGNRCLQGEDTNAKPNYLSVMNYRYQFTGIQSAATVGSNIPVASRLDYSTVTLPTGGNTPGFLDQSNVADMPAVGDPGLGMSEPAGLGGGPSNADIITYTDGRETGIPSLARVEGPVNWDGDPSHDTTQTNVQADTNCGPLGFGDHLCSLLQYPRLLGHTDWSVGGQNQFTYRFQCTTAGPVGGGGSGFGMAHGELSTHAAMAAHVALPIRHVHIVVASECSVPFSPLAENPSRSVSIELLGADDFDVREIDLDSLKFHGAKPLSSVIRDVNGDHVPDLVVTLDRDRVHLRPDATSAHLTGWLKNSQAFIGEDSRLSNSSTIGANCK